MYKNLSLSHSRCDIDDPNLVLHYYRINDTTFSYDFFTTYMRNKDGSWNDVNHLDQILRNIYYAYKFSSQPVCKNFKLVIKTTFTAANIQIKQTSFYKEYKNLIDDYLEQIK